MQRAAPSEWGRPADDRERVGVTAFERGLCPRNLVLGEVSEGAVEAP